MSATMYSCSVPVMSRMLANLSRILDKAQAHVVAHKWDETVLLSTRLFPDMLPLTRQVQLATDFAKGAAARLSGVDVPKFEDTETTIDQLQTRIAKIIAFIESADVAAIEASAEREITVPTRTEPIVVSGLVFLNNMAMPNFYFHVTTSYVILRHTGIEIGKRDFLG